MADDDARLPRAFGEFDLLQEIGRGGMARVYLARQSSLDRLIAIKLLHSIQEQSETSRERFRREAAAAAKLHHPHIVPIHAYGEIEGIHYIAMDYIPSTSLDRILNGLKQELPDDLTARSIPAVALSKTIAEEPTSVSAVSQVEDPYAMDSWDRSHIETACRIASEVASALQYAHENRIYHRDIKPANILIDPEGKAFLTDFGLAQQEGDPALTRTGELTGSPLYMSPEQVDSSRHSLDHRSDIFSLGVTLYELATLSTPFTGRSATEVFRMITSKSPVAPRKRNPTISRDLETIIAKALEKDPDDRYSTAQAMGDDLDRHLSLLPIKARRTNPIRRTSQLVRRNPTVSTVAGVALLTIVTLAFLLLRTESEASARGRRVENLVQVVENALNEGQLEAADTALIELTGFKHDAIPSLLKKRQSLGMEQGRKALATFRENLRSIETLEENCRRDAMELAIRFVPRKERARFLERTSELSVKQNDTDRDYWKALRALKASRKILSITNQDSESIEAIMWEIYHERYLDAVRLGNEPLALSLMEEIADLGGTSPETDDQTTEVLFDVHPKDAALYLFRYEPYVPEEDQAEPRRVPVPIGKNGGLVQNFDLRPGQLCVAVEHVYDDCPLSSKLQRGDLILTVNGRPLDDHPFVSKIDAASSAADAEVPLYSRLSLLNDNEDVTSEIWRLHELAKRADSEVTEGSAVFESNDEEYEVDLLLSKGALGNAGVHWTSAEYLLREGPLFAPMTLECLIDGELQTFTLDSGQRIGILGRQTAYPLVFSPGRRLALNEPLSLRKGSYLVVARAKGREDLRRPFVVNGVGELRFELELLPFGDSPEGFRWIPPGSYPVGGDPESYVPLAAHVVHHGGYWIQQFETTLEEWDAIAERSQLPDLSGGAMGPTNPVQGVSHNDVLRYVAALNEQAAKEDKPWRFGLPTSSEWEVAARGGDSRCFPWGDTFDPGLCNSWFARPSVRRFESVGRYCWDESPFGLRDMAGSIREWLFETGDDNALARGGSHIDRSSKEFRLANNYAYPRDVAEPFLGFRLVARPIQSP